MTTDRRLERLPDLLAEMYLGPIPDYRDDVLARASRTRQRPAWTFLERWLPMDLADRRRLLVPSLPWRAIGILALIAILLGGLLAAFAGSQRRLPPPFGPAANGLIAYGYNGDIYAGDPANGKSILVVGGPENDYGAGFSYDGSLIAFFRDTSPTTYDVYVVRPDGRDLRRVTSSPLSSKSWVNWTPDSGHLAVIHPDDGTECDLAACASSQLDLIDVRDSSVRHVANAAGMDYVQFQPPDAHQLLYRARVDGKWGMFVMDADGTHARPIVPATVPLEMGLGFSSAAYSADGSRIFFNAFTSDASFGDPGCCQLFVVNADGSDLHRFVTSAVGTWDGDAVVSPDGKLIAFWHNLPAQATQRVTVVRADGTGQPIETGPAISGSAHWTWAPDSSSILMFPDSVISGEGFLLDPAGGPWKTVPWLSNRDLDWQRLAR